MGKRALALGTALLTVVSAICLAGMRAIDRKMKEEQEKKEP